MRLFSFGVIVIVFKLELELLVLRQEAQVGLDQVFRAKLEEVRKIVATKVDRVVREVLVLDRFQSSLFRNIRVLEIRLGRLYGRGWKEAAVHCRRRLYWTPDDNGTGPVGSDWVERN